MVEDCLETYSGCPPTEGLPALSADGKRVAVPDFGPDSPRDIRVLTVRILDVDSNDQVQALPVLTSADYGQGIDEMSGERTAAFEAELDTRIQAVDRVMAEGGYGSLTALGTVHEDRPGEEVGGLRAVFDGSMLTVVDARDGQVRWRRAIGPSKVWKPTPELDIVCGPFPVADVSVWVSRKPSVIVALVTYVGADLCATEYPYLVWR